MQKIFREPNGKWGLLLPTPDEPRIDLKLLDKGFDILHEIYEQNKEKWESEHLSEWIVLANRRLVGFYPTEEEANTVADLTQEEDKQHDPNYLPGIMLFQIPRKEAVYDPQALGMIGCDYD
jgi:hypothetical protein